MSTEQQTELFKGRCACNAITYEATVPLEEDGSLPPIALCHCTLCHLLYGSFSTNIALPLEGVKITSQLQPKEKWIRTEPVDRALPLYLCPECGVMLWSKPVALPGPGLLALKTGTLERCREFNRVGLQLHAAKRGQFLAEALLREVNEEKGCFPGNFPGVEELEDHMQPSA